MVKCVINAGSLILCYISCPCNLRIDLPCAKSQTRLRGGGGRLQAMRGDLRPKSPAFFIFLALAPFYAISLERHCLLLHDDQNFSSTPLAFLNNLTYNSTKPFQRVINMQPLSLANLSLDSLVVRPINEEEKPRWNHLIKTYHYLHSCRLVGESIRYIATLNDQWVALLGWTSGAFKLVARDEWIGWTEKQRMERWRFVANSSRLFILPGVQIRNLASKALAINLKRLSHDWMAAYGHPIVLAETFVDPSRFKGTSYRAAGFIPIGNTRGFGISAGNYYYHGSEKLILVRPLQAKAREWLAAPFPIPALAKVGERQPLVDLNRLNLYAENGLLTRISTMPDWRTLSGTIHSLVEILSLVVCAALSGVSNNYQEVYRWIDALPWNTLRRFGCRKAYGPPSETTIRRSMQRVDSEQLCQVVALWLADQRQTQVIPIATQRLRALCQRRYNTSHHTLEVSINV